MERVLNVYWTALESFCKHSEHLQCLGSFLLCFKGVTIDMEFEKRNIKYV